jgi:hypothetical protein
VSDLHLLWSDLGPSLTSWGWCAMAAAVNANDLLNDHVVLDLECLDRIHLNAYVPNPRLHWPDSMTIWTSASMGCPSPVATSALEVQSTQIRNTGTLVY